MLTALRTNSAGQHVHVVNLLRITQTCGYLCGQISSILQKYGKHLTMFMNHKIVQAYFRLGSSKYIKPLCFFKQKNVRSIQCSCINCNEAETVPR